MPGDLPQGAARRLAVGKKMREWWGAKGGGRCEALGQIQCCPRAPIHRPPHREGGARAKGGPDLLCFAFSFVLESWEWLKD
jgi:hypothetical protein